MLSAEQVIEKLGLIPHPEEGGYFRETYRSDERLPKKVLPARYISGRTFGTCIYYLLTPETFSAMHLLESDEIFHFYMGSPVSMLQLMPDGSGKVVVIGTDLGRGESPQVIVRAGVWQGSRLLLDTGYALLGTTVAPGFEFEDYHHGDRQELIQQYPNYQDEIVRLTR